jgi:sulfofructosephosphate aldolase
MTAITAAKAELYDKIARPSGGFAMVANDGRESLRGILRKAGRPHTDSDLSAFKELVARQFAGTASGLLCDLVYGLKSIRAVQEAGSAGLIVAVESFTGPAFGPPRDSVLDREAIEAATRIENLVALKFLIFWRPEQSPAEREPEVRDFMRACEQAGALSLLEGVVTVPASSAEFDQALLAAATEFGAYQPDLYKTQAPSLGNQEPSAVEAASRKLTTAVQGPWVVLSNGVNREIFGDVISAACRGGASGFLAGRAAWTAAVEADDAEVELSGAGRARIAKLAQLVDREARPWHVALEDRR